MVDDEAAEGTGEAPVEPVVDQAAVAADPAGDEGEAPADEGESGAESIRALAWDDDLPVALGEDREPTDGVDDGEPGPDGDDADDADDAADLGELDDGDRIAGRRNALPRRVESWRSRSATGAIATALAMGLQQVFEPERRMPAAVAEAPSNPYDDDDPITVDYVPDDAESTIVHVKPWLLEKGDPS